MDNTKIGKIYCLKHIFYDWQLFDVPSWKDAKPLTSFKKDALFQIIDVVFNIERSNMSIQILTEDGKLGWMLVNPGSTSEYLELKEQ